MKGVGSWCGKPIEELDKEELICVIAYLSERLKEKDLCAMCGVPMNTWNHKPHCIWFVPF